MGAKNVVGFYANNRPIEVNSYTLGTVCASNACTNMTCIGIVAGWAQLYRYRPHKTNGCLHPGCVIFMIRMLKPVGQWNLG